MIAYRQRGLVNVYAVLATGLSVALMPAFAIALPLFPPIDLSTKINLLPYCMAVFIGMFASNGFIREKGQSLHILGWAGAIGLAARQTFYVGACIFALMFATKDRSISRLFLGCFLLLDFIALTILHARCPKAVAQMLFPASSKLPTLFVGRGAALDDLDAWISNRGHLGSQPIGFLADDEPTRAEQAIAPYLGRIDRLQAIIREKNIAQVILLEWFADPVVVERIVEICENEGCRFLIHNNYGARFARSFIPVEEGGQHFLSLQAEPLEDPLNRGVKRLLDIFVSLPVVVLVIPPLTLLVWAVQRWQAPGPVLFVRPRGGQNRREFNMLKYRSMYESGHDPAGEAKQASVGDDRVYPFGRFLRRSSLDEFPQFINVLRGEMSIAGPRPHLPRHDDEFSLIARSYRGRSMVKPGITGLAQVRGFRGEITDEEKLHRRVYWDLYYVAHWSLWLDVQIILRTAWQVFVPPQAAY